MGPMKYKSSVSSVSCGLQYHHLLIKWSPKMNLHIVRTYCSSAPKRPEAKSATEMAVGLLNRLTEAGTVMGKHSLQKMSATCKSWWDRYEDFVGINEVREAQGKVTEAENIFMIARGIVREARENVEAQQIKLKEIRDRLDRVSRDDTQYLELATLEHRLLQEEKRYRAAYLNAEESEREKFSLFSAAVRESHEKERTRAEKTKNWSIIGSVLGAIIGVLGSTYVNRVRLQELKVLVLEAQKGPVNLQEAIKEQASSHYLQQKDLSDIIADLKNVLQTRTSQEMKEGTLLTREDKNDSIKIDSLLIPLNEQLHYTKQVSSCLGSLQQQFNSLQESIAKMISEMQSVKLAVHSRPAERVTPRSSVEGKGQASAVRDVILELCDTERRLETQMKRNSIYSTALTCAMFAVTLPVLYIILKGN
ncbi:mitochondrial potassium channel [Falco biarmicus]|uniref:Coiled-coil domain-containing protein 51 n=1 Tax=Falco tinnunculus TaxID=100819 RepID=A0A8C4XPH7_FALTI|nr:mitochondrial potassium channel [Falco peregrinus]XP_005432592.2 mitochondrial potassium channel [Falco cherrug]XP_013158638.1 mitochondrial potassium channel [Falco peregrinus]XP_014135516.2 mitochondrial potassium channel [Falco cherrug]XP_037240572.1 mitochondrial potassium channel [Falco rusticolus]XP_037240573.1 mitochondrial potassium channel [Falco rusticolus]XP_037240574.1 mitochondrial potassium channel [Falco rusticolus]XP_037240575.1 mitochondrial potassium channel [Falco rusti